MFKVTENNGVTTTYPNITHITQPRHMQELGTVVVAWLEGEPDLWLVLGDRGFRSLERYYAAEWPGQRITYNVLKKKSY